MGIHKIKFAWMFKNYNQDVHNFPLVDHVPYRMVSMFEKPDFHIWFGFTLLTMSDKDIRWDKDKANSTEADVRKYKGITIFNGRKSHGRIL